MLHAFVLSTESYYGLCNKLTSKYSNLMNYNRKYKFLCIKDFKSFEINLSFYLKCF